MTIDSGQQALAADILKHANSDGYLQLTDSTELTISGGAVSVTANFYRVDTESNASTDDLDTITAGTGVADGHLLVLRAENTSRTVVLKHNTGNIWCSNGQDVILDDTREMAILIYDSNLTKWLAKGRSIATVRFLVPCVVSYDVSSEAAIAIANIGARLLNAATMNVYGHFYVPEDFLSTMTVSAIVAAPPGSGNVVVSAEIDYGAVGESGLGVHSADTASGAVAVTSNTSKIITASLSSAASGDYVSISMQREGASGSDTLNQDLYVKGFLVEYLAYK